MKRMGKSEQWTVISKQREGIWPRSTRTTRNKTSRLDKSNGMKCH
jgi:hypothetical protein